MSRVNTCCFCFTIPQGFINGLYLDIGRTFIGFLYLVLLATNNYKDEADKVLAIFNLLAIVFQTLQAYYTLKNGLRPHNFKRYFCYVMSKFLYVVFHFIMNILLLIVKCDSTDINQRSCSTSNYFLSLFTQILWWSFETYIFFIACIFYSRAKKGEYGPPGTLPFFLREDSNNNYGQKTPKIILGNGSKPRVSVNILDDEIEVSIPIKSEEKKKNEENEYFCVKPEFKDLVKIMDTSKRRFSSK